jgi:hypothetical protein
MPVGFIRRFSDTPALSTILAIEGVVTIDRAPPELVQGVNTGEVFLVAEFENGTFGQPVKLINGGDFSQQFGGFGFTYGGLAGHNACARARKSDAAINPEFWNGNGFIAAVNKKFAGLTVTRIDTSVGSVKFSRQAFLAGLGNFSFALATGQTLVITTDAGTATATFTGVAATILSADGVYPTTFAGGEQITFKIDGTTYQAIFLATDQSHVQVVARLNAAVGYTAFAVSTLKTSITGRIGGTAGSVQIVSIDALVATATGFVAAGATAGTGNVPNIAQVVDADADAIVVAASAGTHISRDASGNLRIVNTLNATSTGTILLTGASTATGFGFPLGVTARADTNINSSIPAGTRVRTAGGTEFVTMQDVAVASNNVGPYSVKVRHALDDGTGLSALVSTLTVVPFALDAGPFAVTNDLPITAALTEAALDAAYVLAIQATTSVADPTKSLDVVVSARQSNAIRSAIRSNAAKASANGCNGRIGIVRPPHVTTRAAALSNSAQPGVGTYRDSIGRVVYAFPEVSTFVPQIAAFGTAGGAGFTADGYIDTGFDTWEASVISQLNPEENPGQQTTFLDNIASVGRNNPDVQNMQIEDYEAFKAAGIAAFRQDGGDNFIQSGVTTVDITSFPALAPISRRRMADFIQDSGANFLMGFIKKLARVDRKAAAVGGLAAFLEQLKSAQNPALARIDSYAIDAKSGNTAIIRKQGIFWIIGQVVLLPSLDVIVFDTTIGATVTITIRNQ